MPSLSPRRSASVVTDMVGLGVVDDELDDELEELVELVELHGECLE